MIAHWTYTSTLAMESSLPHILKIQLLVLWWALVTLAENFKVTILIRFQPTCQEMAVLPGLRSWEVPTFMKLEITVVLLLWLPILNPLLKLYIHSMKVKHGTSKQSQILPSRLQISSLNHSVSHNSLLFMEVCKMKRIQVNTRVS